MPAEKTSLYRLFNEADELLYVGIAVDHFARWKTHRSTKPWAREVTMRVIEWYPSRSEALAAEVRAICAEKPRYNIRDSPDPLPRRLPRPSMRFLAASEVDTAVGYLAIQDVAEMLNVSATSVNAYRWRSHPGRLYANDPFPAQDTVIRHHPAWGVDREDEIRQWYGRRRKRKAKDRDDEIQARIPERPGQQAGGG